MTKSEIFYSIINKYKENLDKNQNLVIDNIVMNSKDIVKGDLFVAIRGGNNYINEALKKNAYVVYDNIEIDIIENNRNNVFYVKDSIEFLQEFARKWRMNLKKNGKLKVVAITGSNGKTTVKDMIFNLLKTKYKGKKTEGNYNNHIGLPFTLLCSELDDDFLILEMGMSGFGEIDLLGQIAEPDISVLTNIGESHLEYLKTKENVFKAKTEIIPYTRETLIINGDDEYLKRLNSPKYENKLHGINLIKVLLEEKNRYPESKSNTQNNNFYYSDIDFDETGTKFTLKYFGQICKNNVEKHYKTNVLGEHNILNLVIAIAVAKQFSIEDKNIEEAIKNIVMTDMRFQKVEKNNKIYINDAYNASPMSMRKSLETFSELYNFYDDNGEKLEKIVVLGDMLELGENEIEFHVNLYEQLENMNVDKIYLYGSRMEYLYKKLIENGEFIKNKENIGNKIKEVLYFTNKNDIVKEIGGVSDKVSKVKKVILLKGSRGMKLEEIII